MVQFNKLKLSGFKSFLHPTEIEIGIGKTGVVGPNGCGKSNLLEALGWVMGETSARKLRGGAMDDVIFNGTKNKAARNTAEVTVILDNSDLSAPPPYNKEQEIEITRRIERGVGSDYYINGQSVRAKDVQLLFADLVTGANSPALVSQGRINAIIQAKPVDRRRILEDAAGISGLHVRRHEAELKLRGTETNLERLDDVVGSMKVQLENLKKQARQAIRYKNISEKIKDLEAIIYGGRWQETNQFVEEKKNLFEKLENNVNNHLKIISALYTKQANHLSLLPDLRKAESKRSAILQRLRIEQENLQAEHTRLIEKKQALALQTEQIHHDITHEKEQVSVIKEKLEKLEKESTSLNQANTEEHSTTKDKNKLVEDLRILLHEAEENQQHIIENLANFSAKKESLQKQKAILEDQIMSSVREEETAKQQLAELEDKKQEQLLFDTLYKDQETLEQQIDHQKSLLVDQETIRENLDQQLHAVLTVYQEQKQDLSRLEAESEAIQSILSLENGGDDFEPVLKNVVAEKGYEAALASALGDGLAISDNQAAPLFWSLRGESIDDRPLPGHLPSLQKFIKAPAYLKKQLSQVGIAETKEQAEKLAPLLSTGQTIVLKDGTAWHGNGINVTSKAPNKVASLLEQKNRLLALEQKINVMKNKVQKTEQSLEQAKTNLKDYNEDITQKKNALETLEVKLKEKRHELGSMQDEIHQQRSKAQQLIAQAKHLQEQIKTLQKEVMSLTNALDDLGSGDSLIEQKDQQQTIVADLRHQLDQAQSDLTAHIQAQKMRTSRLQQLSEEIFDHRAQLERSMNRAAILQERLITAQKDHDALQTSPKEAQNRQQRLEEKIGQAAQDHDQILETLQNQENTLREIETELKREERDLGNVREERALVKADYAHLIEKLEEIRQAIYHQFDCQPEHLLERMNIDNEQLNNISLLESKTKLEQLHDQRERMGPVNLRAETESEALEKEIDEFLKEKEELIHAVHKLRHAIGRLNSEARERFLTAFEAINTYFKDVFSRLFGGGNAYLELTEAADPLEAGLEIFAQPPGKKLQNLSLLSGGEQTLTSIALVFSMFLTNPSPICVLDEIDAALDDANVDRVCTLLDEMAAQGKTKFLVISHHKMTVARMDRLYGVTMAERGISQLVSVDLSQPDLLPKEPFAPQEKVA